MPHHRIVCGHVIPALKALPDECVDMLMTSVPYWNLRDYGEDTATIWGGDMNCEHEWVDNTYVRNTDLTAGEKQKTNKGSIGRENPVNNAYCSKCNAWRGQLGLEETPELYVSHLRMVFGEVKRVLKKTGTCWVNIGDSYNSNSGFSRATNGWERDGRDGGSADKNEYANLPAKCMCMIPERFAFMMLDLGYTLRNKIIWEKDNPMPSSVKDRFNTTWEYVYFFTKNNKPVYWYNDKTGLMVDKKPASQIEGVDWDWKTCPFCDGTGVVKENEYTLAKWCEGELKMRFGEPCKRCKTTGRIKVNYWHSVDYWFDLDAVREEHKPESLIRVQGNWNGHREPMSSFQGMDIKKMCNPSGKNPGDAIETSKDEWLEYCTYLWSLSQEHPDFFNINTQPFPEAHFACVSEDTEILTIDGWKKFDEIKQYERSPEHILVATYNFGKQIIEYQRLSYLKAYDVKNEPLIKVGNRDLDILMTPNHRNVVLKKNGKEEIVLAENLAYGDKIRVRASIIYPENNGIGKTFSELVGWILAEGHYKKGGYIEIYQNEGVNAKRIDYLLKKSEIPHTRKLRKRNYKGEIKEQVTWFLKKSPLIEWMLQNIPNKELNRFLVSLPQEEIKVLFSGLIRGDGDIRKDDNRESFIQKSKECIDWFSILALRLGYHCIVSPRKDNGVYTAFLTKRTHIGVRKTNGKGKSITTEQYKGKVWCPKVKNGTWVARRNGRIFITGNTFPEKLVETPLKCGCPAEVCSKCGMARVRITETTEDINNVPKEGWKKSYKGKIELNGSPQNRSVSELFKESLSKQRETIGWTDCLCSDKNKYEPGICIDPFGGSGTVGIVAEKLGRSSIIIDIKRDYCEMAIKRLKPLVEQTKLSGEQSTIKKEGF